jgi:protein-arginine kinase activator protein McsA
MTTFNENSNHFEDQIRKLDQQYELALQRGEEFSVLKRIRDQIKTLKDQAEGNGSSEHNKHNAE